MNRIKTNREIVRLLTLQVEAYPEMRFHQLLWLLGLSRGEAPSTVLDLFYEESAETLERLNRQLGALERLKEVN